MGSFVEVSRGADVTSADVVVIGAGLVGLATGFYAAKAGLGDVVVLEAGDRIAGLTAHASAAGFRLEWDAPENIEMVRSSIETFKRFDEVIGVPGYSIDMHLAGYLFLSGSTPDARREARFGSRVEWWHDNGLRDVELMSGDQARARWSFVNEHVEAAHYRSDEGYLNVADVARGYLLGGSFKTLLNARVAGVETSSGRVNGVRLVDGSRISASTVVVAAGPFSAELVETTGARLNIVNKRRHALIVPAPADVIDPSWPVVLDAELGMYWRPRTEGRTTTGVYIGWERALPSDQVDAPPADPVPVDGRYLDAVRTHGGRLVNVWDRLEFDDVIWRAGQYTSPGNEDGRPMIGPHPDVDGLFVNTAYEGRGVMASPAGSEMLVRTIQGETEVARQFSVSLEERSEFPDLMVL